ncbi:MAG: HAD hydrolase-like protein [Candidatus Micrarchaeales archaeon]
MQILSKYDLFIFDWDHTLTTSTILVSIIHTLNKNYGKLNKKSYEKEYDPRNAIRNIRISEDVSRFYSFFDDIYFLLFRPKLKENSLALLDLLRRKHKKIAIFSDSKTYRLVKETRELGVIKYLDCAISAESIDRYKPDPSGLFLISDKLRIPRGRSVYIGDMASDMLTAKFAGMESCAVSDGVDSEALLKDTKPTYLFRNLREFLEALQR